jgi:hypothetical protein
MKSSGFRGKDSGQTNDGPLEGKLLLGHASSRIRWARTKDRQIGMKSVRWTTGGR